MERKRPRLEEGSPGNEPAQAVLAGDPPSDGATSDLSPFERLPDELKWIIFKKSLDSLHLLQLTSKTLYKNVNEWTTFENLPIILRLKIEVVALIEESEQNADDIGFTYFGHPKRQPHELSAEVTVSRKTYGCFKCLHGAFNIPWIKTTTELRGENVCINMVFVFDQTQKAVSLLKDVLAMKFETIEFTVSGRHCVPFAAGIVEMVSNVKECRKLVLITYEFCREYRRVVEELVSKISIERVELTADQTQSGSGGPNLSAVLLYLAERVPEILIRALPKSMLKGLEWGDFAVDLFTKGARMVCFAVGTTYPYSNLMKKEQIETVRSYLASAPTNHVFCTRFLTVHPYLEKLEHSDNIIPGYLFETWSEPENSVYLYIRYRQEDLTVTEMKDDLDVVRVFPVPVSRKSLEESGVTLPLTSSLGRYLDW